MFIFLQKKITKRFRYKENIDPIYFLKAKKNRVEINNSIKAHILDGVALTKFIYWNNNNNFLQIISQSLKNQI